MHSIREGETEDRASHQFNGPGFLAEVLYRSLPAFMLAAVLLRPVGLSDLGWQVRLGELILHHGSPYITEPFAATHLGEQLTPNAWLAQLVFYQAWHVWGLGGLRALDALFWMGGLLVVAMAARRGSDRPLAIVFAVVVAFVVALPTASIRPQSFASLAFGLTLVLIRSAKPWPVMLALGVPLFVTWQNFHPSVSLVALIIGVVASIRWCLHFSGRADRPWDLSVLAVAAAVSVFCTPAGIGIIEFARYNAEASFFYGATEWLPLWSPINREFLWPVIVSAALTCTVAIRHRERICLGDIVSFVITLVATLAAVRFVLFYTISLVSILSHIKLGSVSSAQLRRLLLKITVVSWALCVAEFFIIPVNPESEIPAVALRELNATVRNGTVFCDPAFGGVLIDAGFPHRKVAFDGRFYIYRIEELRRFKETRYNATLLPEIERMYQPVAFALVPSHSLALIREMRARPDVWRETHSAADAVFFVRSSALVAPRSGD